jgi:PleD family two-component response regulator
MLDGLHDAPKFKRVAAGARRRGGRLQRIAQVIDGSTVDTNGLSARYGGEEFAIVTPCETIERQEGSLRNSTRERPSPRSR